MISVKTRNIYTFWHCSRHTIRHSQQCWLVHKLMLKGINSGFPTSQLFVRREIPSLGTDKTPRRSVGLKICNIFPRIPGLITNSIMLNNGYIAHLIEQTVVSNSIPNWRVLFGVNVSYSPQHTCKIIVQDIHSGVKFVSIRKFKTILELFLNCKLV